MSYNLVKMGYIPLDKSWIIRMGVLDLVNECEKDSINFLRRQQELSNDLDALYFALKTWYKGCPVNVGESGTLYRFLKYIAWKQGKDKEFVVEGTLKDRQIYDSPDVIEKSMEELLRLDGGTSQWASIAYIMGDRTKVQNPPYKLQLTYDAVRHWENWRKKGEMWIPRYDRTILRQADNFLKRLKGKDKKFKPLHSEDFFYAVFMGDISIEEGEAIWPSLRHHETNRVDEAKRLLNNYEAGNVIETADHRAMQAIAMKALVDGNEIEVSNPHVVRKSWHQFWKFLDAAPTLLH